MVDIAEFVARWSNSHGSERGNSQRFLTEFISVLELPLMPTAEQSVPSYQFEHFVPYKDDKNKTHDLRIDLYKHKTALWDRFIMLHLTGRICVQAHLHRRAPDIHYYH